jgi:hypothetical protein
MKEWTEGRLGKTSSLKHLLQILQKSCLCADDFTIVKL